MLGCWAGFEVQRTGVGFLGEVRQVGLVKFPKMLRLTWRLRVRVGLGIKVPNLAAFALRFRMWAMLSPGLPNLAIAWGGDVAEEGGEIEARRQSYGSTDSRAQPPPKAAQAAQG